MSGLTEMQDERIITAYWRLENRAAHIYDQKVKIDQELRDVEREIIVFCQKHNDVLEGNVEGYIVPTSNYSGKIPTSEGIRDE